MGISRSASTVIAYAMKEYGWDLEHAFHFVKEKRQVAKPNSSFMRQLVEYQGILDASKQRHNKLWRSHSDSNLNDRLAKPGSAGLAAREQRASMTANGILSRAEEIRPQTMATDLNSLEESSVGPDTLVPNAQVNVDQPSERTCRVCKRTSSAKLSDGAFNGQDLADFLKDMESIEGSSSCFQLVSDESTSGDMADISTCQTSSSPHTTPHTSTSASPPYKSALETPSPTASSFPANYTDDKIDFFSAREKFKELYQEWKGREKLPSRSDEPTVPGRGAPIQTPSNENTQESGNLRRPSTSVVIVDSNPGNGNNNNNNTNHMSKDADCVVSSIMQPLSVKVLVTEMEVVKSQTFSAGSRCQSEVTSGPASRSTNSSPDSPTAQYTVNTPPPTAPTIITSLSCCHALSLDASSSLKPPGKERLRPEQLLTDEEACKNEKLFHFNELCDVSIIGAPIPEKAKKAGAFCKPRRSVSLCSDRSSRCGTVRRATLELEERLKEQEITCSSLGHRNTRSERPVEMEKGKNMEGTEADLTDISGKGQRECVEPKVTTGEIKTDNAIEALTEIAPLGWPIRCPLSSNMQESKLQNLSTENSNEDRFAQAAEKTKCGFFDTPLPSQRIEIIEYADIWPGHTSQHPDATKEDSRHSEEKHGGTVGNPATTHPPFQHSHIQLEESALLTKPAKEPFGHLASSPGTVITKFVDAEMRSADPWAQSVTDVKEPASKLQVLGLVNNDNVDSLFKMTTPSLMVPGQKDHGVECAKETIMGAAPTVDKVRDKRTAECSINPHLFCPAPYANMTGNSVVGGGGRPWTIGRACAQVDDSMPVKQHVGLVMGSCMKRSHTLAKLNSLESLLPNESPTIGAEAAETVFMNQAGLLLTCVSGIRNAVCTNGPSSSPSPTDSLSSLQTDHSSYAVHGQTEGEGQTAKEMTCPIQHCFNFLQPIRRQHRKTHPLWRLKKTVEKKRTSNPQYNTV
uniref:protein phosphatase Slingshot homolog 2-like n=1 Tax=Myxine glutinosa TaxID=7769 RepID=UPI00358FD2B9